MSNLDGMDPVQAEILARLQQGTDNQPISLTPAESPVFPKAPTFEIVYFDDGENVHGTYIHVTAFRFDQICKARNTRVQT